ncbi:survival motor neuron-like protein 1 [Chaetomidium leptoderma]|uniref:Survival motor neuron-like protein 1 n=1 Tax=Chaetomidium leptoderma TaxID=669021 RepID=A0AAN6VST8_9PEZI|nr:survival motor neuron-like protein 1 [Chaetomidium leptoderma]
MQSGAATHEEIWDDSALVDSWNQALEEYKKYHSVHAKGGTVDDIPNGADEKARSDANAKPETGEGHEPLAKADGAEEGEIDETIAMDESDETWHPAISDAQGSVDAKKANEVPDRGPAVLGPQALLGTVQDEELKNLLMSWYYAGYYTGLHEGKQQGLQQAEQVRKGS